MVCQHDVDENIVSRHIYNPNPIVPPDKKALKSWVANRTIDSKIESFLFVIITYETMLLGVSYETTEGKNKTGEWPLKKYKRFCSHKKSSEDHKGDDTNEFGSISLFTITKIFYNNPEAVLSTATAMGYPDVSELLQELIFEDINEVAQKYINCSRQEVA